MSTGKNITIYFGDLTHTSLTISNDSFPLNIGYVAAYLHKYYPDIEVELFKYPEDLKRAIDEKTPDILALSNYPWNLDLHVSFFEYVKQLDEKIITVMGGPNMSYDRQSQEAFMNTYKDSVDIHTILEGERTFKQLMDKIIEYDFDLKKLKYGDKKLIGCIYLDKDGNMPNLIPMGRHRVLDEYPSPYLLGYLDKFFDGKLSPMIETHRGCPYSCTFCHEGSKEYQKINKFPDDRIVEEVRYIANHVGDTVSNLMIADPNFGVFKQHIDLSSKIVDVHNETGYPKVIFATTAKNSHKILIEISKLFQGKIKMPIWMSVQSLDKTVQENIKRKNISTDSMYEIQKALGTIGRTTLSELIMDLPGETFETHVESIVKLISMSIDKIAFYQLMLVNGSEMKSDKVLGTANSYIKTTKFRVLPRNFSNLDGMRKSIEVEEIATETHTWSFEKYLEARKLHLLLTVFYSGNAYKGFFKLATELGVDLKQFFYDLLENLKYSEELQPVIDDFMRETKGELWDSEEELLEFYEKDENYKGLLSGVHGGNLLQKYTCICYLEHTTELVNVVERAILKNIKDKTAINKVKNIARYYKNSYQDYLCKDRLSKTSLVNFDYDVTKWLVSEETLDSFQNKSKTQTEFHTPKKQFDVVENYFKRYGRSPQAFGKILTRLWISDMMRIPRNTKHDFVDESTRAAQAFPHTNM